MNESLPADGREDFYWQITLPTAQGRPEDPQVGWSDDEWFTSEFVSETTTDSAGDPLKMELPDGSEVLATRSTWRALIAGPYAEGNPGAAGVLTEGDIPMYVKIENERERVIRPGGVITVSRRV